MSTPEDKVAGLFRTTLEMQLSGWKAERAELIALQARVDKIPARIAELTVLITVAEDPERQVFTLPKRVDPKLPVEVPKVDEPSIPEVIPEKFP